MKLLAHMVTFVVVFTLASGLLLLLASQLFALHVLLTEAMR